MDRIEEAGKKLQEATISRYLLPITSIQEELKLFDFMDAIEEYIDAKVDARINDLRNEINKTGEYDPDY